MSGINDTPIDAGEAGRAAAQDLGADIRELSHALYELSNVVAVFAACYLVRKFDTGMDIGKAAEEILELAADLKFGRLGDPEYAA